MRPRVTEVGEHAVTHVFGDVALEAGDLAGNCVLIGTDHLAHLLGIEPARQGRRVDQINKHNGQLTPLCAGHRRCSRCLLRCQSVIDRWDLTSAVGFALEGSDGVEHPTAVADRCYADVLEVLTCQPRQQIGIDVILAERRFVLLQTQASQPSRNVHFGLHSTSLGHRKSFSLTQIKTEVAMQRHALDREWVRLEPLLPRAAGTGRPAKDHRTIINALLWLLATGAPWRDLPERAGPQTGKPLISASRSRSIEVIPPALGLLKKGLHRVPGSSLRGAAIIRPAIDWDRARHCRVFQQARAYALIFAR